MESPHRPGEAEEAPPPFDEALALCPLVDSEVSSERPSGKLQGTARVQEAPSATEGGIEALVAMGFAHDAAVAALLHADNDVETAVALLAADKADVQEQGDLKRVVGTDSTSNTQASKWVQSFRSMAPSAIASKAMAFGQKLDAKLTLAANQFDKTFDKADELGDKAAAGVQKMSLNVASKASSFGSAFGRKISGVGAVSGKAASGVLQEAKAVLELSLPLDTATVSHQLRTGTVATGMCISGEISVLARCFSVFCGDGGLLLFVPTASGQVILASETVSVVSKLSSAVFSSGPSSAKGEVVGLELDQGVLQRVWRTEFLNCGVSALAVCEGRGDGESMVVAAGDDKGGLGCICINPQSLHGGDGIDEVHFHPSDRGGRREALACYSLQHGQRVCALAARSAAGCVVSGWPPR